MSDIARRRIVASGGALNPVFSADITCPSDAITVLRTVEPDEHRDVLNTLIAATASEPATVTVIVHAYVPAILRPHRVVPFYDGHERDDVVADLIEATVTVIRALAHEPASQYPGTRIRRAIDNAARRWQHEHATRPEPFAEIGDDTQGTLLLAASSADRCDDVDYLLELILDAARTGRITPEDALFTARTILGDDTTRTEADRRFVCLRTMQQRHKQTIEAIVDHALARAA